MSPGGTLQVGDGYINNVVDKRCEPCGFTPFLCVTMPVHVTTRNVRVTQLTNDGA